MRLFVDECDACLNCRYARLDRQCCLCIDVVDVATADERDWASSPHTPLRPLSSSAFGSPSSLRADEDVIVLELGARNLRIGFAGDAIPVLQYKRVHNMLRSLGVPLRDTSANDNSNYESCKSELTPRFMHEIPKLKRARMYAGLSSRAR